MAISHSDGLKQAMARAHTVAASRLHQFVTPEHLLLGLLDDPDVKVAVSATAVNGSIDHLRAAIVQLITDVHTGIKMSSSYPPVPTLGVSRAIQRAEVQMYNAGKREVKPVHVLISLFEETDSHALYAMTQEGMTQLAVKEFNEHGIRPKAEMANTADVSANDNNASFLTRFSRNLNQLARDGKIDPLIGRRDEVKNVAKIMKRRTKNNAILVGEAGVGKTAIVEGMAVMIENNDPDIPAFLHGKTIYDLDTGRLLAGTKYRGDYEERLKGVIAELIADPDAIVFIDEIHTLLGAGASSGGGPDASNLLKPALDRGQIKTIGATTIDEYRRIFEKDAALSRRFKKVDVNEPGIDDAIQTLRGVAKKMVSHHGLKISDAAIIAAVKLAHRHITNRRLPDSAIDILDDTCAAIAILAEDARPAEILIEHIENEIAASQKIPSQHLRADDRKKMKSMLPLLQQQVFGQDHALEKLTQAYKRRRAGFGASEPRPILQAILDGPTGVGKTETARQLAKYLSVELLRFDMSEYMERHTVSRLIGAPPGYVGYDQGGLLTEAVTKNPHCVLLLDEVEKAHPDIFNILLQVMDNGVLTDGNGRKCDFKNVIILMTTNLSANDKSTSIGFTQAALNAMADPDDDCPLAVKKQFPPEFRNRLDAIVSYHDLDRGHVRNIAEKFLRVSQSEIAEKKVTIVYDSATLDYLAQAGMSPDMGARPMKRKIKALIEDRISNEILEGALVDGGTVTIGVDPSGKSLTLAFAAANQNKILAITHQPAAVPELKPNDP